MNQPEKRANVAAIVRRLNDDLSTNTLSDTNRQADLEQLKIYGRVPTGSDAIYCESGITTLTKYAFGSYSSAVVQEALRVVANALMQQPSLQLTFIELDGLAAVATLYQNPDDNFEFLGARILFLCTYAAEADFHSAFSAGLLASIEQHLARHAVQVASGPMETMAMSETTKLIFNLNNRYPQECKALDPAAPSLCTILRTCKDVSPPLDSPINFILNALACLDFGAVPAGSTAADKVAGTQDLVSKLIDILARSITHYKPIQLDVYALSLITVLRMLYDTSSAAAQASMRAKLLPADSERDLPLGQSSSLASQILRLATESGLMHLPEAIGGLLFEMSNKDATTFVRNIGLGYAAGYLMTHQIPLPQSLGDSSNDPSTIRSANEQIPINPVTGQRLDRETVPDGPEMTEEEKEQEAERLFVLFERLRATGVVTAENPVRQAMEQGRLEEVSDNEKD